MQISYDGDTDGLETEDLAPAFNILMALVLKRELTGLDGFTEEKVQGLAESITFGLAMMFDDDVIKVSDKEFRPRIAFEHDGKLVNGAAEFSWLHEYAASPFDDLDGLEITDG